MNDRGRDGFPATKAGDAVLQHRAALTTNCTPEVQIMAVENPTGDRAATPAAQRANTCRSWPHDIHVELGAAGWCWRVTRSADNVEIGSGTAPSEAAAHVVAYALAASGATPSEDAAHAAALEALGLRIGELMAKQGPRQTDRRRGATQDDLDALSRIGAWGSLMLRAVEGLARWDSDDVLAPRADLFEVAEAMAETVNDLRGRVDDLTSAASIPSAWTSLSGSVALIRLEMYRWLEDNPDEVPDADRVAVETVLRAIVADAAVARACLAGRAIA